MKKIDELAGRVQGRILLRSSDVKSPLAADAALQLFTETRLPRWEF
jgi:hypothetical protein